MKKIYLWKFFILAALHLVNCVQVFCTCSQQGLLSNCFAQASHCRGFCCQGAKTLDSGELSCWGTQAWLAQACGILLAQGLNTCACISRQNLYHWTTREAKTRTFTEYQNASKIYLDISLARSITFKMHISFDPLLESIIGKLLYLWTRQNQP